MALDWRNAVYQEKSWINRLEDTVPDALYHTRRGNLGEKWEMPMPGAIRKHQATIGTGPYRNVECHGECVFRWGVNRKGDTINAHTIARYFANQAVTADVAGTVSTFTDTGQFTEHEEVGNKLFILDNADAAGGAPEGQWGIIVANDENTLTVQPDFTLATAVGDTGIIVSDGKLDILGAAIERRETFGVALVDVPDNYWAWFLCFGEVTAKMVAATAITGGAGLIGAAAGLLDDSSTSGQDIMLARADVNCSADIVSDLMLVFFDVYRNTPFTSL